MNTVLNIPINLKLIHEKALTLTQQYKKSESDLLDVIIQIRENKIYRYFECTSVFEYCVKILKLDPGLVYGFTAVAKKIKEVPELQEKISEGALNVSTAKRITSVLTPDNKNDWFEKALNLTARKLEKEVAKVNPRAETKERASYLNSKRVKLELGLDEKLMLKIRRIQDLESQKQRRSVRLEEVFETLAESYLHKNDPVEKAKRATIRSSSALAHPVEKSSTWKESSKSQSRQKRRPLPARQTHQVYLRDKGRCQHINTHTQTSCGQTRYIEIHHKKPLSLGGGHELQNLITLCSEHHKMAHQFG